MSTAKCVSRNPCLHGRSVLAHPSGLIRSTPPATHSIAETPLCIAPGAAASDVVLSTATLFDCGTTT